MSQHPAARAPRYAWLLLPLLALLPFEPRRFALPLPGMLLTVVEVAAIIVVPLLAIERRSELMRLVRAPPWPLALLGAYAGAHLLSAAVAEAPKLPPLKFALRMAACAGFAFVVAAQDWKTQRRGIRALAWSTLAVAVLAVLEGSGVRAIDPFLDLFRQAAFQIGSTRRATAGSEYPNLAGAFLVIGLLAWAGLARSPARAAPAIVVLVSGVLFTYSRGALVAASIGLAGLILARRRSDGQARPPTLALAVLGVATVTFAAASETFQLRLRNQSPAGWYAARYMSAETTLLLLPGQSRPLAIEVENVGAARWATADGARLVQRWFDPNSRPLREGPEAMLAHDVGPGERATVDMEIRAPSVPGRYQVFLDLRVGSEWLSDHGVRPGVLSVESAVRPHAESVPQPHAARPEDALPAYWQPTRAEFARLALAMWRDRPLTGVGPDNFRLLHARYAGRPHPDPWAFASNSFLEVAATTGLLGLVSFVATLCATAAAAVAALRRATPGRAADWASLLVGLVAALVAQDCGDYFLEATGHYLFFGFLVGAVARARSAFS